MMDRPIRRAGGFLLLWTAATLFGCASGARMPGDEHLRGLKRLQDEVQTFAADSASMRILDYSRDLGRIAASSEKQENLDSWTAYEEARQVAGVALAAALAHRSEVEADSCRRVAADVHREWQDAVRMLEQTERIAGRTARGVPRTSPDPVPVNRVRTAPTFQTRFDPAAIEAAARESKLQAERLEVPVADLETEVLDGIATASAPKLDPALRDHQLRRASWAASEMEFRVAAAVSRQACAEAMARALELASFRDQTLWSMVDLERSMKDSARDQLEEERKRLADREQSLYESLQQFEGKFATIRREARGTIMSLSDILFDFGKAELRRDAEINLAKVAVILAQFPEMGIQVEGHTDNIGSEEYNLKLSERRAAAVSAFLTEQGIATERMTTMGYGMSQPVASNETPEGRQQNRRVDLVIREE